MKAMILAAGRGERMRPLTDTRPKPLLKVAGIPLLVYHIKNLVAAGLRDIVINHAWLGEQIVAAIGDGSKWGAKVVFSPEPQGGLETQGGIVNALPLLLENNPDQPFVVVNGDIWTDFDFSLLPVNDLTANQACLILVDNPAHNPDGDFALRDGLLANPAEHKKAQAAEACYTYSGIAVYHPDFFAGLAVEKCSLVPLLRAGADDNRIVARYYAGHWTDVGTVERLAQLELEQELEQRILK
ncbi:MAG: MurNAc alpha-1-phosphate uridylyltransferase [Phenylobacterium sp.]|jgi:MurNAc alpha-1-phosphate uridylyltransferase